MLTCWITSFTTRLNPGCTDFDDSYNDKRLNFTFEQQRRYLRFIKPTFWYMKSTFSNTAHIIEWRWLALEMDERVINVSTKTSFLVESVF